MSEVAKPPAAGWWHSLQPRLRPAFIHLAFHSRAVFFFASSLLAAIFFGWNNTDLVWGFWTTSFIVGNVALLRGVASPLATIRKKATPAQWKELRESSLAKKAAAVVVLTILACGYLALSAFLAVHFTVFHLGHAWILQGLLPHPELARAMEDPATLGVLAMAKILLASYWVLVAQKLLFDRMEPKVEGDGEEPDLGDWIKLPYLQVARVHLIIFAVVGMNALGWPQGAVYATIFTIFFFPLQVFRRAERANGQVRGKTHDA